MTIIEIQTMESGRLKWMPVFGSTSKAEAVEWGNTLLAGFERNLGSEQNFKPALRVLDELDGNVIGAWQTED